MVPVDVRWRFDTVGSVGHLPYELDRVGITIVILFNRYVLLFGS